MNVVLGAGLAGLTAGIDLAKMGRSVIVLEKENFVGGHASSHRLANGYVHDMGFHVIIPDAIPLYEMVKAAGIENARAQNMTWKSWFQGKRAISSTHL